MHLFRLSPHGAILSSQRDRSHLPYRTNVGAILRRHDGRILLCERIQPAGTWQFPKGGSIFRRATKKHFGASSPRKSACAHRLTHAGWRDAAQHTNYEFAPDYEAPIAQKYRGQKQTLFLLDFRRADADFDLEFFHEPEFQDLRWVSLQIARETIGSFKRVVLEATLEALDAELRDGFLG